MKKKPLSLREAPSKFVFKSRLADRLEKFLQQELQNKRWTQQLPSERHLSLDLNVSRPTLRLALRALELKGIIRLRKRQSPLVLKNPSPHLPLLKRSPKVLILQDAKAQLDFTFLIPLTEILRERLHDMGYGLITHALFPKKGSIEKDLDKIDAEYRPSFYILSSVPPLVHQYFQQRSIPAVILGSRFPKISLPAIGADQKAMTRHAANYLMRRGHRRLCLLTTPPTTVGDIEQNAAFLKTCAEWSGDKAQAIMKTCGNRPSDTERAVRRIFSSPSSSPTAIIVTDFRMCISLYSTLGILGLKIPRSVSIVCCAFYSAIDSLRPAPTCYCLAWKKIAHRVLVLINEYQRTGRLQNASWKILHQFHEGESVASSLP